MKGLDLMAMPALKAELAAQLEAVVTDFAVAHGLPHDEVAAVARGALDEAKPGDAGQGARIYGVAEIAAFVGVSHTTLRQMAYAGDVPVQMDNSRTWWASKDELEGRLGRKGDSDRVIGVPAISALIGVSIPTAKKYILDPAMNLPVRRVGGRWWSSKAALIQWCNGPAPSPAGHGSFPEPPGGGNSHPDMSAYA